MPELIIMSIFLIFSLILFWFELSLLISIASGSPYVNAPKESVKTMLKMASIQPSDIVYDLGSGDGRLVFHASALANHAVGIEINPILIVFSKLKRFIQHKTNISFVRRSIWRCDFSKADVVFVYLLPPMVAKLEPILLKELKKGSRIIIKSFPFPNTKPDKVVDKIFLYTIK